ncbi:hypothetical protein Q0590_08160 [Rhodocytophaga aerolata]|uniref:Uncharacterized protein n=1 Tax=Rhodocytophaga aerolata TaxID=455078 RepID=A0ABT8R289_9BACT|nr:hypothetical protein [Rhodocytophaga aerolata]MDO1446221.1 hypothetical protein [Rhodocytophaga aerolata]
MSKKNRLRNGIILGILALLGYILYDSFSQPSTGDLSGEFKEVAFYRNENNTGPVNRIYAVTLKDTLWQQMQTYGELMPHTKYGTTKVYYFLQSTPAPTHVSAGKDNFEDTYKPYCLAVFEKDALSRVSFKKYPFR